MRMRCVCLLVGVWMLWAVPVQAQTVEIPPATPFTVEVDHDGANATAFRVYVDEELVRELPASPAADDGIVSFTSLPGVPVGPHTVRVTAVWSAGEVTSPTVAFAAVAPPQPPVPPSAPRIIVVTTEARIEQGTDGSVRLLSHTTEVREATAAE